MSISAAYAQGSSGGPVFDRRGQVIGMVSATHTIYAEDERGPGDVQMVEKMCVPVERIRALITKQQNPEKTR